jgi:DNA-binding NtrC family response regulator
MLIRILVVVEAPALRGRLEELLARADVLVSSCDPRDFWAHPEAESFDLAVAARAGMPADVKQAVSRLRQLAGGCEVIVLRAGDDARDTAALQAAGCFAIVPETLPDQQLRETLAMLVQRRREGAVDRLRAEQAQPPRQLRGAVSESPVTRRLLRLAARVAASDTSLLILGETGVGKEWLARAVHAEGPRAGAPFIAVNCGAMPENLLESELYGHERGAFTGAVKSRRGYFELAHGGTLFLDEVAEMAPHLQVKLLRALQDRTIQRVGAEEAIAVDVRIIAATNRDLVEAMKAKDFRQDLYYRLAVVTLTVPPLRERVEDLPALVDRFLNDAIQKLGRYDVQALTPAALEALAAYAWPGNVRELVNVVERAVLLCDGERIDRPDLPDDIAGAGAGVSASSAGSFERWLDKPLEEGRQAVLGAFEKAYIEHHLGRNRGNVGATAEAAEIDPRTLYNKMRLYGLRKEDFK